MTHRHYPARRTSASTLTDPTILGPALVDAFRKLDPRAHGHATRSCSWSRSSPSLTTILFVRDLVTGGGGHRLLGPDRLWLWFTVLFANFAEAVAEGRGKAQAATLRTHHAPRPWPSACVDARIANCRDGAGDSTSSRATSCWSRPATSSPATAR